MRKRLLFFFIFLFLVIASYFIYSVFSAPQLPSGKIRFYTSTDGAYRTLVKQDNWDMWSPHTFSITKKVLNGLELKIINKQDSVRISILLIPLSKDSVDVSWYASFPVSNDLFARRKQWSQYDQVTTEMNSALKKFQSFVQHTANVYGITITETSTTDTLLVATRFQSSSFPSNQLIYENINKLRSYAAQKGAAESGFPMLNISTTDSSSYNSMVALPINKAVQDKNTVSFVRMVPGRFLTTEVTGGPYTIRNAHRVMNQYFKDFNRVSMGIPFEYLVTDRLREPDTTKWTTRIYYPVY